MYISSIYLYSFIYLFYSILFFSSSLPGTLAQGAFTGGIVSLVFMFWIGVGHQVAKALGQITLVPKPTSIDGCLANTTSILTNITTTIATTTTTAATSLEG